MHDFFHHPVLYLFRRHLQHVILHITERCSLRCKTCFVVKRGREMGLEEARGIARWLGKVRWLDIGGGEPFLHPDLVAICGLFPDSEITIPTNGQAPEHIAETVRDISGRMRRKLTVALSVDGFEATNDAIRGEGVYQRALRTFELVRPIPGIDLKINTVVCNRNLSELLPFMRHVRSLNPDYQSLLLVRGTPEDGDISLPPLEDLEAITEEVLDILGTYCYGNHPASPMRFLKKRYQHYLWQVSLKTLKTHRCLVPCKAPWLHKVVYPDGSLSMCELMPPSGNLFEEPLAALEQKMAAALEEYACSHGPCYCTHNCNLGENIQTHPRSVLSILLGIEP